jgi:hypothetical protein
MEGWDGKEHDSHAAPGHAQPRSCPSSAVSHLQGSVPPVGLHDHACESQQEHPWPHNLSPNRRSQAIAPGELVDESAFVAAPLRFGWAAVHCSDNVEAC